MALLVAFAALAGAGTALTPCVLPVLPGILTASATGGRRRPFGVILGLTLSHTVAIVGIASVIDGVGLAQGVTRTAAIAALVLFGSALVWPRLAALLERPFARLARFGPTTPGSGFWSGVLVGAALGLVYAPCAGPILAAVISLAAVQGASAEVVAVALGYGLGTAAVLLAIAYGGRRALARLKAVGRGATLQRGLGIVMVASALAMAVELDLRFQSALANDLPSFVGNPTGAIERSAAVEERLAELRGESRFDSRRSPRRAAGYPVLGQAPDFAGEGPWLNTAGARSLSLAGLRGRVVLVDFWTYTCINCLRTLPHLRAWDERYRRRGLTIVGVHTPEFSFERERSNVERAISRERVRYPVLQDNDYATWTAWGNQYWPAKYLVDARGQVRYTHFGEGEYAGTEAAIRSLLAEAGVGSLGARTRARGESAALGVATPETYLGFERAEGFVGRAPRPGVARYVAPDELPLSGFALDGTWSVGRESATALREASLEARFRARKVFLVLSSRGGHRRAGRVLLDGTPIAATDAGEDVRAGGRIEVTGERLYRLVALAGVRDHTLRVELPPGVTGYAFTFG